MPLIVKGDEIGDGHNMRGSWVYTTSTDQYCNGYRKDGRLK